MAVTSIWPIKGRVDKVINYARNPEKTHDKDILNAIVFFVRDGKGVQEAITCRLFLFECYTINISCCVGTFSKNITS